MTTANDPWDLIGDLRTAWEDASLAVLLSPDSPPEPSYESRRAAFRVARAHGSCLAIGLHVPEPLAQVLSLPLTLAACRFLCDDMQPQWLATARRLPQTADESDLDAEVQALELVRGRTEAWAVQLAAEDAYDEALEYDTELADQIDAALERCCDALGELDRTLREGEVLCCLAVVVETGFLEEWRGRLAGDCAVARPWWLDGVLDRAHEAILAGMTLDGIEAYARGERVELISFGESLAQESQALRIRSLRPSHYFENILPEVGPTYVAAAGERSSAASEEYRFYYWRSPDQQTVAVLTVPVKVAKGDLRMRFVKALDRDQVDDTRIGIVVYFCGSSLQVGEDGVVTIPMEEARRWGQECSRFALETLVPDGSFEVWETIPTSSWR